MLGHAGMVNVPRPVENRRQSDAEVDRPLTRGGERLFGWALAGAGLAGIAAAAALRPVAARSAAAQDWPPFVLVAGLLLIGLVADDDSLFAAAGHRLARSAPSGVLLFMGAVVIVGSVTGLRAQAPGFSHGVERVRGGAPTVTPPA